MSRGRGGDRAQEGDLAGRGAEPGGGGQGRGAPEVRGLPGALWAPEAVEGGDSKATRLPWFPGQAGPARGQRGKGSGRGDPVAAGCPASSAAGLGLGAHLAYVEVQHGPLAAQGTVLDVAGGGQSQEAEQAAGEAGSGHGAGALGPGSGGCAVSLVRLFMPRGRVGGAVSKRAAA